jgi:hypothetical protein
MVVGFTGYWHLLAHLINVCIKKNADSNSSLQQRQQQQILYLLRHNSVQEFIA